MKFTYSEIIYTSSQFGILNKSDGFGVRTLTEGLPSFLTDEIKNRNLFLYSSGSKQLAGTHQLLDNPNIIYDYPVTYAYYNFTKNSQSYYILLRTVFIGRDYGWYLNPGEAGARSGNTFTHALVFDKAIPGLYFSQFIDRMFVPTNLTNVPDNSDLRAWLTGTVGYLLEKEIHLHPESRMNGDEKVQLLQFIRMAYTSILQRKPIIIRVQNKDCRKHLNYLFHFIPQFYLEKISLCTNYQSFHSDTGYSFTFINEFFIDYDKSIYYGACFYDLIEGYFTPAIASAFVDYLALQIELNEQEEVENFLVTTDAMVEEATDAFDIDLLYGLYNYLHPFGDSTGNFVDVVEALVNLPLKEKFKDELPSHIERAITKAFNDNDYIKIIRTFHLIQQLKDEHLLTSLRLMMQKQLSSHFFIHEHARNLLIAAKTVQLSSQFLYTFLTSESIISNFDSFAFKEGIQAEDFDKFYQFALSSIPGTYHPDVIRLVLNRQIVTPAFTTYIVNAVTLDQWSVILKEENFFFDLDQTLHHKYLARDVQLYLTRMAENENPFSFKHFLSTYHLNNIQKYYWFYIKALLEKERSYEVIVSICNQLSEYLGAGYVGFEENTVIINRLLKSLTIGYRTEYNSTLLDAISTFTSNIGNLKNSKKNAAQVYQTFLQFLKGILLGFEKGVSSYPESPDFTFFKIDKDEVMLFIIRNIHFSGLVKDELLLYKKLKELHYYCFAYVVKCFPVEREDQEAPVTLFRMICKETDFFSGSLEACSSFTKAYILSVWSFSVTSKESGGNRKLVFQKDVLEKHTGEIINHTHAAKVKYSKPLIELLRKQNRNPELSQFIISTYSGTINKIKGWVGQIDFFKPKGN